jgi:hypothetical protein
LLGLFGRFTGPDVHGLPHRCETGGRIDRSEGLQCRFIGFAGDIAEDIQHGFLAGGGEDHHQTRIEGFVILPKPIAGQRFDRRRFWQGDIGLVMLLALLTQGFEDLGFAAASELEEDEGILAEPIAQEVIHRADMLAGIDWIGAVAFAVDVEFSEGEEAESVGGEDRFDRRGHFSGEEFGGVDRFGGHGFDDVAPLFVVEGVEVEGDFVGFGGGALDAGDDFGCLEFKAQDVAFAGVDPGAFHPSGPAEGFEHFDPALDPPFTIGWGWGGHNVHSNWVARSASSDRSPLMNVICPARGSLRNRSTT